MIRTGELIEEARERVGVTQLELSQRMGITQQAVSKLEKLPTCTLKVLFEVAAALRMELRVSFKEIDRRRLDEVEVELPIPGRRRELDQLAKLEEIDTSDIPERTVEQLRKAVESPNYIRPAHSVNCKCGMCKAGGKK